MRQAIGGTRMAASEGEEFFGSPAKVSLMRRSQTLWLLLRDDPRFSYYGRTIFVSGERPDTARLIASLARLTGASFATFFPKSSVVALFAELHSLGLSTDRHEHFRGGDEAYAVAKQTVREVAIPSGLSLVRIGSQSGSNLLKELADLWEECGVMPVPGSVMRGLSQRGVVFVAIDRQGKPVSAASSFAMHHPDSIHANDVFWGMLATSPEWRGMKLGLLLGAHAIIHMWENEGARGFSTGVRAENHPSRALCKKLAVRDTDWIYASCIDPELLGSNSITK
jgi:hypothetical protein